jgi:hypothetical protein
MPVFDRLRVNNGDVGTLVTLELPAGSPALTMPWIITFGPLDTHEEWEPVVCGPYERTHALGLAESVISDEELMAVVEPVQPYVSVDQIRGEISAARTVAAHRSAADDEAYAEVGPDDAGDAAAYETSLQHRWPGGASVMPGPPPTPDEVRAGFARLTARLAG